MSHGDNVDYLLICTKCGDACTVAVNEVLHDSKEAAQTEQGFGFCVRTDSHMRKRQTHDSFCGFCALSLKTHRNDLMSP